MIVVKPFPTMAFGTTMLNVPSTKLNGKFLELIGSNVLLFAAFSVQLPNEPPFLELFQKFDLRN